MSECVYISQDIPGLQGNSNIQNFKICVGQKSNWGSPGCLCHQMPYTTELNVHIQEHQIWKYKLDKTPSGQSYKKSIFAGFGGTFSDLQIVFTKISNTFSDSEKLWKVFWGVANNLRVFSAPETQYWESSSILNIYIYHVIP